MSRGVCMLVMIMIAAPTVVHADDDIPDVKGTWVADMSAIRTATPKESGAYQLAYCQPGPCKLSIKYVIDMQDGNIFSGTKYGPTFNQTVIGVIDANNRTVHMVDQKGFIFGEIIDPAKIHLTFLEHTQYGQVAAQGFMIRSRSNGV